MITISTNAELWVSGVPHPIEVIEIRKDGEDVLVKGQKVTVKYNGIQLRLIIDQNSYYMIVDERSDSDLSVDQMSRKLSD